MPSDYCAEHTKNIRSNPKCRQIEALARKPAQEAVPAIIEYFADPNKDVRTFAMEVVGGCFRHEAESYIKKPLSSRDKNTLGTALNLVGICAYSTYKQDVRDIAWSADDETIQFLAVLTLRDFNDEEGLRRVARSHPKVKVRAFAERVLRLPPH